jgi:hypothetical protein
MDTSTQYGQMNMNLPHDVVELPSKGKLYKNKRSSLKVGYLTAQDENILIGQVNSEMIIPNLLRSKIYEPGFNVDELIDGDVQAILIFLRNTAFGPDYNFLIKDPKTGKDFEAAVRLDELDVEKPIHEPNEEGFFQTTLPKSGSVVKCRVLTMSDQREIDRFTKSYPNGMNAPIVTKRLEMMIVEIDGDRSKEKISTFISQMPIADSKHIRTFIAQCEPRLNLKRNVIAPSGETLEVSIGFGAEFFRPFYF